MEHESEEHIRLERLFMKIAEIDEIKLGKANHPSTVTDSPEFACGLYINIDNHTEQVIVDALMKPARKKIEVAIKYRGITKEFTFTEFFKRLGFYDKKEENGKTSKYLTDYNYG